LKLSVTPCLAVPPAESPRQDTFAFAGSCSEQSLPGNPPPPITVYVDHFTRFFRRDALALQELLLNNDSSFDFLPDNFIISLTA
jgi:hypothetical protein